MLDWLKLLNIARGRAHLLDTSDTRPERYRFQLWASASSYLGEHTNQVLGNMPAGLMREDAIEDYWEVVTTGVPTYHLIHRTENQCPYSYSRLLLPVATDGRRVNQLLVLVNERRLTELDTQ